MEQEKLLELLETINQTPPEALEDLFEHIHPSDLLELINDDDIEFDRTEFLDKLPYWLLAELLNEEQEEDKYELLSLIASEKHPQVLEEMASDELADLIGNMQEEDQQEILSSLSKEDQQEVTQLLTYEPTSAGGIMQTEFVNIYDNKTVGKCLSYLREIKDDLFNAYALFVVDRQNHIRGLLDVKDLVTSEMDEKIMDIMNPNVFSVHYSMDQEDVANEFEKYNLPVMPVVDDDNVLIGIITFDDIMEVMQEEASADMLQLAGMNEEEDVESTIGETIKSRLPWLLVNLLTALLSTFVIGMFSDSIAQVVALASLMPIISGLGGNVGTQTLTLMIRSIALGELDPKNVWPTLIKEVGAALFNGFVLGILTGFVGLVIGQNVILALVVGASMFLNTFVAVIAGFFVPYILERLNIDPAISSSVFVTATTDMAGFTILLGLASLVLTRIIGG